MVNTLMSFSCFLHKLSCSHKLINGHICYIHKILNGHGSLFIFNSSIFKVTFNILNNGGQE